MPRRSTVARLKNYKPISRILLLRFARNDEQIKWLPFICPDGYPSGSICLPCTLPNQGPNLSEQLSKSTIRGISACKVYPRIMLPLQAVSSYLTFSSLPAEALAKKSPEKISASEVIFCGTICWLAFQPATRLFTGAMLCAVRTFLPTV
jgi:hypothetical protein